MHDFITDSTPALAAFLAAKLPALSTDWWQANVVQRLSFQQQRFVQEKNIRGLQQLDFAALLRVLDQNWYELSNALPLPREGRNWVKELQLVRNRWAHRSGEPIPPGEVYRDADTLGRLLQMIGAPNVLVDQVEAIKGEAIAGLSKVKTSIALESQVSASDSGSEPTPPATLFRVGDLVVLRSNPKTILPVIEVVQGSGECRYRVFQDSAKATYYESQLQSPAAPERPRRILTVSELHAALTSIQLLSPSTTNLFSLRSGRVTFVPYQYRPVLKLIRSDRPRLLIADEVGVGKTIEAGLIIKELRARIDLSSVLVICPKALVAEHKWKNELKRFDEHFTELDGRLLQHCLQETDIEGQWPEQYSKAILPFSLFDSNLVFGNSTASPRKERGLLSLDPAPKFDLVIVDEAHHIRNSETFLHQGIRFLCDNANAVIFLSATPVQLGSDDLYTLLNVLRPDLVIDHTSFEQMSAPNRHINAAVQVCRKAGLGWQQEARAQLEQVATTEWGRLFIRESPAFQNIYDRLGGEAISDADRVAVSHEIEDLYTFRGLINRTRRRDIGDFTVRKPETLTVEFTPEQKTLHDDLLDLVARILVFSHGQQNVKFMMTTIRRQAASCLYGLAPLLEGILNGKLDRLEFLEASDADDADAEFKFSDQVRMDIGLLLEKARNLAGPDPKVDAFMSAVMAKSKMPNNKALVFSTFRHTLAYLASHVENSGLRFGLIHGDVTDEERANLRRRFGMPKEHQEAIDVLLSSEVGCEGLDFQFCDFLINYDLPWNPMRIEQRIGRIDRYGQRSETVAIVNLITPGTVDAEIYQRCLLRIGVFKHAIGGNEEILGEITRELHDIAESFTLTPIERDQRLQQLADNSIRRVREEQELEAKQVELFGLNIPNQRLRDELDSADSFWLSPASLMRCVSTYLSGRLGSETDHILGEKGLKTLRLNENARLQLLDDFRKLPRIVDPATREWERWLKDSKPTVMVTFEQESAAENPTAMYLSIMHPLVRQAARWLQLDEPAYVSLVATSSVLPQGKHRFALYRWIKKGIKADEVLVPVASESAVEGELLKLLQNAVQAASDEIPNASEVDVIDLRHHTKWVAAQAIHATENRTLAEHRIQSLSVSHRARQKAVEDQIARAGNVKIQVMKQSELARANADYQRHLDELEQAANSGDIHAKPVLFGVLNIEAPSKP